MKAPGGRTRDFLG